MAKKLLSVKFASISGMYAYNLGCNSSDNIPQHQGWIYSRTEPLNQVGCTFIVPDSRNDSHTDSQLQALHDAFKNAGYGIRNAFLPSTFAKNVPLYLNGVAVSNGTPMPYLQWENGSYCTILVYYRANGTRLGPLWSALPGTAGANFCSYIAGQLYDDGTFTGCAGPIKHHTTLGITSHKYYDWSRNVDNIVNTQLVNPSIIADLVEYLPVEPEGEFTDNGNGDFDTTSDPIDFPNLPSLNVIDTGMTQIYEMTSTQLRSLSNYLWTSNFSTALEKMFNDPMESILNLSITPVDLTTGALTSAIRIGNLNTTVTGQRITAQYKMIDFGTINMNEYWANFGDYSPYTKLSIYLPYVGVQQISIDDVQNGSIQLKCVIDVLTGSIQYMLYSIQGNRRGHGHSSILYTWGGNCQYQVPLSASNMTNVITSIIGATGTIAGAVGATVATGGLTAPMAVGAIGGVVSNVANAKTHVQRGGGLGGAVGLFGVQYPYLILERPEQIAPENYPDTMGIPNESTDYIKNYEGFVKVRGVNLNIPTATTDEIALIENLLKGGVLV